MFEKMRDLTTDIGVYNDLRYSPYSADYWYTIPGYTRKYIGGEDWLRAKFYAPYRATSSYTMAMPSYIGKQIFSSSQEPRPKFNNCHNYKCRAVTYPYLAAASVDATYRAILITPHYRLPFPAGSGLMKHQHIFDSELQFVRSRAWASMQPRFEGEISMLNFLFELKDFKDIARLIFKPGKLSGTLKSVLNDIKTLKRIDPTKPLASAYLTYRFAYLPTVSDLSTLFKQAQQIVEDAQKQFQLNGLELQKSHYTEIVGSHRDWVASTDITKDKKFGSATTTKFTATMQYRYQYELRKWLDAVATYWGLYVTPEAVWNGLPGSFILDYFIQIGKALHMVRNDPNVDLSCIQYCESLLTESGYGYFAHPYRLWSEYIVNDVYHYKTPDSLPSIIAGTYTTLYDRTVTRPTKGLVIPRFKLPNTVQTYNLLALARCFL